MDLFHKVNFLLLDSADFLAPDRAVITGRRLRQLIDTIRAEPGKLCKAGVRGGDLGSAEVVSIDAAAAELRFIPERRPPPPLPLILVAALPRPQTFDKVLHVTAAMGVKRIFFINSFKVEKSYWQASRLAPEAVEAELALAMEQCGDTIFPEIEFRPRFRPFVEDELPELLRNRRGFYGNPAAPFPVPHGAVTAEKPAVLAVGPEGGFTDYENSRLEAAGMTGISLGCRVLRTEFAVAALLARLGM